MTAYADIIDWAATRPWWQQRAIVQLASGTPPDGADHEAIADALVLPAPSEPDGGWLAGVQQPAVVTSPAVTLKAIRDVNNVNRLATGEILTFDPTGVTVVYGTNGSGKSGYARLVKSLVRTRHQEQVLPDIFSTGGGPQAACLEYEWNGHARSVFLSDDTPPELQQVSFYDERCGDLYVSKEGEALYRPSALRLMEGLIDVCDGVRQVLDERLAANAQRTIGLPALDPDTVAGRVLSTLTGDTDDATLDQACKAPDDTEDRIEVAREEESRLRATNPEKEAARLHKIAGAFATISAHLAGLEKALGADVEHGLASERETARQTRALADEAASSTFEDEPLRGVGSPAWRALWAAARRFSEDEAYPHEGFPRSTEGSHCVLCHQTLSEDARVRLERFHAMMVDTTQDEARAAATRLATRVSSVENVQIEQTNVTIALRDIQHEDERAHSEALAAIEDWRMRREALLASAKVPAIPNHNLASRLETAGKAYAVDARLIDTTAFDDRIGQLARVQKELRANVRLAEVAEDVRAERDRRREEALLQGARRQTDTRGISRALGDLTASHVTAVVQDHFSRESKSLQVDTVTLLGQGVRHGSVLHKPAFVGAAIKADLPRVLSEGEQTALGLSGYFVEACLDASKSALVLDDPVTSLDHLRRDVVAERLAGFAKDRQVIVFTHDVAFAATLKKRARANGVGFTERTIERRLADGQPGMIQEKHPWAIKDTPTRIHDLRDDLASMTKKVTAGEWTQNEYDNEVSKWAGRLSQTWERVISQEVADFLFDRSTLHVSVTMVKIAERITEDDNRELQDSYGRCSGWTRHDQDVSLNYVPPTLDALTAELDRAEAWYKRVKGYRK